jgi:hypothetical protein
VSASQNIAETSGVPVHRLVVCVRQAQQLQHSALHTMAKSAYPDKTAAACSHQMM